MPGENKTLFLFTVGYPYGTRDEPFLENEIEYLSKAFDEVVIFPTSKPSNEKRKTPENVSVNDCLSKARIKNKKLTVIRNLFFVLKVILPSSLNLKRFFSFWRNTRLLLDIISVGIIRGITLEKELKNSNLENVIFYDYWFANSIYSISYLKTKRKIKKFICRAHRYEIYDENWPTFNVPFFEHRIKVVDELYFISRHGFEYINNRTPKAYKSKLKINYLGVKKPNSIMPVTDKKQGFTIVSCARVVDFKRIHKIPLVLKALKLKIKWIHFGDGPFYNELKQNIKKLPENIEVELMGHVSNEEVKKFYESNKVDLLLSLSLSEGLPVSMMEALSYGIPILAVDAGGVNEIVQPSSGALLENDASFDEIAEKLNDFLLNNTLVKEDVIKFYDENFNAKKNYIKFIASIKAS